MERRGRKKRMVGPGRLLVGLAFFLLVRSAARSGTGGSDTPFGTVFRQSLAREATVILYDGFLPLASYEGGSGEGLPILQGGVERILPLYGLARREMYAERATMPQKKQEAERGRTGMLTYEELLAQLPNALQEQAEQREREDVVPEEETENLEELLRQENEAATGTSTFVPNNRKIRMDMDEFQDYETLVQTFYTIDANTMAGSDQLNVERLLGEDMTIDRETAGPQILIYHTHSQEGFADSVPGDAQTGIMGVGEHLAEVLREQYGYNVLHHTGQYDVETRNNAYGNALPELERILAENPSIQVVIDLHRDQMPEETKLVLNVDGRPTARFMFFNGLSRTRKTGDIAYLKNENIGSNLAFSFRMQLAAMEYYPGLTRKIYLKGYRYNMHVCPKSLLVELGAQNNTVEEAMNACEPLAHVLDLVIGGEGRDF